MLHHAKELGIPIATDVHALSDINDEYNQDFMEASDILFLSHEHIPGSVDRFAADLSETYNIGTVVVGLGADGALLYLKEKKQAIHLPAVATREIVNTIGAGDALFSCYIYMIAKGFDPISALKRAIVFASWKIGEKGAAHGFFVRTTT